MVRQFSLYHTFCSEGYSEDYSVSQLSPNPFYGSSSETGSMNMDILVITPQTIRIDIFDLLGQNIQSFTNDYNEPTSNQFLWNGKNMGGQNVSSGIYFIKITGQEKSSINQPLVNSQSTISKVV